jgi:organic hydroperoxide reductase OsmC/OhrA
MSKQHHFAVRNTWTGNTGQGTANYRAYKRDHEISGDGKAAPVLGSSAAKFRGDDARYNPEELLIGSLSACHMLWMLHLCADAGIAITEYIDQASGVMEEADDGSGRLTEVTLHPAITITDAARIRDTEALNERAHELCFIANSVNFPVHCEPAIKAASAVTSA